MTVTRKIVVVLAFAPALALFALALYLPASPLTGDVSTSLQREIREKKLEAINLAELTNFSWTEMFAFGPYRDRDDICPILGLSGFRCWWVVPAMVDEGHYFLAFRDGSEIAHYEHHRRRNGDFYGSGQPQPVRREDAQFVVVKGPPLTSGDPSLPLRFKSL
jgi:hypothetical protein